MALSCTTRRFTFRSVHHLQAGIHREETHGHQYFLEVSCLPGAVLDVSAAIKNSVLPSLDGRDLCQVVNPATGEGLVEWIHSQIIELGFASQVIGLALQETRKNRFISRHTVEHLL